MKLLIFIIAGLLAGLLIQRVSGRLRALEALARAQEEELGGSAAVVQELRERLEELDCVTGGLESSLEEAHRRAANEWNTREREWLRWREAADRAGLTLSTEVKEALDAVRALSEALNGIRAELDECKQAGSGEFEEQFQKGLASLMAYGLDDARRGGE